MKEIQQAIVGSVLIAIGIILLVKHKTFVKMAIESQKGVDSALGKRRNYSAERSNLIPKIIVIIIGIGFSIGGVVSILANFFSF
jgi:hypothetical protein